MATAKATTSKTADTAEVSVDAKVSLAEVRKPLFASVGVADLAVTKLRELPSAYAAEIKKISGRVNGLPNQVKEIPTTAVDSVKSLPTTVTSSLSDLSGKASELSGKAAEVYGELATRGEKVVTSIRKSPATEEAAKRTKTAVSQAKAARTSATKAAGAVTKAASNAAASL